MKGWLEDRVHYIFCAWKSIFSIVLLDILNSVYITDLLQEGIFLVIIAVVVNCITCAILAVLFQPGIWNFYWRSNALFAVIMFLQFFVVRISLLPRREESIADVIMLPLLSLGYLLVSELLELVVLLLARWIQRKTGDGFLRM